MNSSVKIKEKCIKSVHSLFHLGGKNMDYLYLAIIALLVIINIEQRIKHDGVLKIDVSNPDKEV